MSEINEIIESIKNALKERIGSIMYGMFFISWLGWNWEAIYATFFVDQEIIFKIFKELKIDYIQSFYPNYFWLLLKLFIGPIVSTYIIIWWISKIDLICSIKHYKNKAKKEIERAKIEEDILKQEQNVLKEEKEVVKKKKEVQQEIPEKEKWLTEIKNNKRSRLYNDAMKSLETCLYKYKGNLSINDKYGYLEFEVSPKNISFLDTNDLINFTSRNREKVELTRKGKYFLKEFIKSNHNHI